MSSRVLGPLFASLLTSFTLGADPIAVPKELKDVPASIFSKVVDGTTSKDGRFAAAFGLSRPSPIEWKNFEMERGSFYFDASDKELTNFLVDLKTDRVVCILKGRHFSNRPSFNHELYQVAWSDDGKFLAETQSWKWHTGVASIHRLDDHGVIASTFDLLPLAKEQLRMMAEIEHEVSRKKFENYYQISVSDVTVDTAGKVSLEAWAEVPSKNDPFVSMVIQFTVQASADGKLTPAGDLVVKKGE